MELTNPSLRPIDFLIGKWTIELSNGSFLPKNQIVSFSVNYGWQADGSVIAVQQKNESDKFSQSATWIIGRDESDDEYTVLYADSRGVSRVYLMSYKNNVWKMWRDNPKFSQRFKGIVSEDKKIISAYWETSTDGGKTWQHDFDMKYERK